MDHKNSHSASYAAAGVDITAGYKAVELMKKHVARTKNEGCLDDVGGFGGCFGLPLSGMEEPVLVSGTDGCGTKVKLAILMDKHDTIGIDAVAMCVNDIICVGAKPLFFLDYIACGKNVPEKIAEIVGGVAEGCVQSGAALIGGETAEHPGLMPVEDYDLAGFAVGVVDKKKILNKDRMAVGDVVIALPSTGIHSNGFSLCRKVFNIDNNDPLLYVKRDELGGKTIAEALLTPTKIYVKPVLALLEKVDVKGISHITGGGFYENIPRSIPKGLTAKIDKSAVKVLPIFDLIAKFGNIPERDMFNTYNMGVGMSIVVPANEVKTAMAVLAENGQDSYVIGEIVAGDEGVILA
ncbi:MAG: phosphoribosylformylglycinamidine cyclo-ligase [Clostridia bacterium]|nr:phosphoribosylformylglycinamidine cyclo-ligase [Clostridia bacterium]MBQ8717591.1 phosphoribosylformylglycinamidine cyclo-ligase [Clostridia bacterium]